LTKLEESQFEIIEAEKRGFELRFREDQYWRARAIIYDEWVAKRLAFELGIKVHYNKINSRYKGILL